MRTTLAISYLRACQSKLAHLRAGNYPTVMITSAKLDLYVALDRLWGAQERERVLAERGMLPDTNQFRYLTDGD